MRVAAGTSSGVLEVRRIRPSPVVAMALHSGHGFREELRPLLAASDEVRRYEEDPGMDRFVRPFPVAMWSRTSRFELDLNRPEERAVSLRPEDCWGIGRWKWGFEKMEAGSGT